MNCRVGSLRVMGIDPGLARCDLSIAEGARGRRVIPIAVGVAHTPTTVSLEGRPLRLSNAVEQWMDECEPGVVAMERVFERGNVSIIMQTAHAVGVLVLAATGHDLEVYIYTPSGVKKVLTGNGRAGKKQVTMMVTRILGLEAPPKPADVADALAITICHCWRDPVLQHQRDTLAALAKQCRERELELSRRENPSRQRNLLENSYGFGVNRGVSQGSRSERDYEK